MRARSVTVFSLAVVFAACATGGPAPPIPEGTFAAELAVDLSAMERTATGLYVRTVRPGDGSVAEAGDRVVVHYEGWLPDGTRFESSRARHEPLEVPLGMDILIDGWDEGIAGMRVGELRRLVVPSELGYGDRGSPGVVPPDTPLLFEIELLGIK